MKGRFALGVLAGWASGLTVVCAGALAVVMLGLYDTAATRPHPQSVAWIAHNTMIRSVQRRAAGVKPPQSFTPTEVAAGQRLYLAHCAGCHGGPGAARGPAASGMTPTPPFLIDASRRWSPGELYWIISRGVKMTAMPAWGRALGDARVWSLVAFLERLPNLTAAEYRRADAGRAHTVAGAVD